MLHAPVAIQGPVALILSAPTGVAVSRNGIDGEVSWSHSGEDIDGYRVYRRVREVGGSFDAYQLWGGSTPPTTEFLDDDTAPDLEYQYQVTAFNDAGESAPGESNVLGIVPPPEWLTDPADDPSDDDSIIGEAEIVIEASSYQFYGRVGTSMEGDPLSSPTGTELQNTSSRDIDFDVGDPDLEGFLMFRAQYPGTNRFGSWSVEKSATSRPRVPGAPASVTAVEGATSITVTVTAGSPATAYDWHFQRRERNTGETEWATAYADISGGTISVPDDDIEDSIVLEGKDYQYRARGENSAGDGDWTESNVISFGEPPAAPSGLTATPDATFPASKVDLAWTENAHNADGQRVQRATSSGGPYSTIDTISASAESYEDEFAGPPAGPPVISSVDSEDDDKVVITLSSLPEGATGWKVYWKADPNFAIDDTGVSAHTEASTGLTTTISGLTPNTEYGFIAVATNSGGQGFPAAIQVQWTGPTAPLFLQIVGSAPNHSLLWSNGSAPRDDDLIRIERNRGGGGFTEIDTEPAGSTSSALSDSQVGDQYRIRYNGETTYSGTVQA